MKFCKYAVTDRFTDAEALRNDPQRTMPLRTDNHADPLYSAPASLPCSHEYQAELRRLQQRIDSLTAELQRRENPQVWDGEMGLIPANDTDARSTDKPEASGEDDEYHFCLYDEIMKKKMRTSLRQAGASSGVSPPADIRRHKEKEEKEEDEDEVEDDDEDEHGRKLFEEQRARVQQLYERDTNKKRRKRERGHQSPRMHNLRHEGSVG